MTFCTDKPWSGSVWNLSKAGTRRPFCTRCAPSPMIFTIWAAATFSSAWQKIRDSQFCHQRDCSPANWTPFKKRFWKSDIGCSHNIIRSLRHTSSNKNIFSCCGVPAGRPGPTKRPCHWQKATANSHTTSAKARPLSEPGIKKKSSWSAWRPRFLSTTAFITAPP